MRISFAFTFAAALLTLEATSADLVVPSLRRELKKKDLFSKMKSPSRRSSSGSSKDKLKEQCLLKGYRIEGTTKDVTGALPPCCVPELSGVPSCVDDPTYFCGDRISLPWVFNRDLPTGSNTSFSFSTEEHALGDGSLCIEIGAGAPTADKGLVEYRGTDLIGKSVCNMTSLSYLFKVKSCGTLGLTCANQAYLNIYTHSSSNTGSPWFDCRYDFVASSTLPTGQWNMLSIGLDTVATSVAGGAGCPSAGNTLQAACDAGYLLGTATNEFVFVINWSDTSASNNPNPPKDIGSSACFDDVRFTFEGETKVFDFEPDGS